MRWLPAVLVVALAAANAGPAGAQSLGERAAISGPAVPVSALALPNLAFDPSRLHFSMSVAMGSGFGSGTQGLQVASLSYQFQSPMWLQVSLANRLGSGLGTTAHPFLEGVSFGWRPTGSMLLQFQYQDLRSPLQLHSSPFGYRGYGY